MLKGYSDPSKNVAHSQNSDKKKAFYIQPTNFPDLPTVQFMLC